LTFSEEEKEEEEEDEDKEKRGRERVPLLPSHPFLSPFLPLLSFLSLSLLSLPSAPRRELGIQPLQEPVVPLVLPLGLEERGVGCGRRRGGDGGGGGGRLRCRGGGRGRGGGGSYGCLGGGGRGWGGLCVRRVFGFPILRGPRERMCTRLSFRKGLKERGVGERSRSGEREGGENERRDRLEERMEESIIHVSFPRALLFPSFATLSRSTS
jgi:hypothetical protein